jgi:hypothetical protein
MEYLKLLVEFVKAIAWPVAVIVVAWAFRSDVKALFPRLTKAGPGGLEFGLARQTLSTTSTEVRELPGFPHTPAITKLETRIHDELKLIDPDRRIDVAVRQLATVRIAWAFEQIYRTLYGSQIRALIALSNTRTGSAARSEAEEAFNQTKAAFPEFYEKNTFDEWIRYPMNQHLIETDETKVNITQLGNEFLEYLGVMKLSDTTRPW